MRKFFLSVFSTVVPLVFLSFGRASVPHPLLTTTLSPEWTTIFSLSEEDLSVLYLPSQMLTPNDFFLQDDPVIEMLFDNMVREVVEEQIPALDYDALFCRLRGLGDEGNCAIDGPNALTLQGVFEESLVDGLSKGLIHDVSVVFLTNAPKTHQKLTRAGGKVLTVYPASLSRDRKDEPEQTCPLYRVEKIPQASVGTVYQFTTQTNHTYFFVCAMQEMWLASSENPLTEANHRRVDILNTIIEKGNLSP